MTDNDVAKANMHVGIRVMRYASTDAKHNDVLDVLEIPEQSGSNRSRTGDRFYKYLK